MAYYHCNTKIIMYKLQRQAAARQSLHQAQCRWLQCVRLVQLSPPLRGWSNLQLQHPQHPSARLFAPCGASPAAQSQRRGAVAFPRFAAAADTPRARYPRAALHSDAHLRLGQRASCPVAAGAAGRSVPPRGSGCKYKSVCKGACRDVALRCRTAFERGGSGQRLRQYGRSSRCQAHAPARAMCRCRRGSPLDEPVAGRRDNARGCRRSLNSQSMSSTCCFR